MQRLFRRYARFGDPAARDELVERFLPLARGLARRYHRGTEPLDDLIQVASIGLLNAIDRFDPERGREFTTYAVPTIIGELKRYYRDHGWAMKVMRGDKERVLDADPREGGAVWPAPGRAPTPLELAEHTGLPSMRSSTRSSSPPRPGRSRSRSRAAAAPASPARSATRSAPTTPRSSCRAARRRRRTACGRCRRASGGSSTSASSTTSRRREIGEAIGVTQMQVSRILRQALERSRSAPRRTPRARTPEAPSA